MADVFISHSSMDKEIANLICETLESNGIKCWIAPRDIEPGADWSAKITEAINDTKVFIIIYSENSSTSAQVPRELTLAGSSNSLIIPYKVDNAKLMPNFQYYLMSSHWVNASAVNQDFKLDELYHAVNAALFGKNADAESSAFKQSSTPVINVTNYNIHKDDEKKEASPKKSVSKKPFIIGGIVLATLIILALLITFVVKAIKGAADDYADVSGKPGTSSESGGKTSGGNKNAPDIAYCPQDKVPYENHDAKILDNDLSENYTVLGKNYNTGVLFRSGQYIIFDNSEGYTTLSFTAAKLDNCSETKTSLQILADGIEKKLLNFSVDSMPYNVEIDIANAQQIKIIADCEYIGGMTIAVKDMFFSKNSATPEAIEENTESAPDIAYCPQTKKPYENHEVSIHDNDLSESFTILGKNYNSGLVFRPGQYVIFDNPEGYTTLSFTAAKLDNSSETKTSLRIIIDGNDKELLNFSIDSMPYNINIDITNAKQIKIIAECDYIGGMKIALKDMYFSKNGAVPEAVEENTEPAPDIAYCPQIKKPYENNEVAIHDNDLSESFTILGKNYNNGLVFKPERYVIFDNPEGYTTLSFTAAKLDNCSGTKTSLRVIVDGKDKELLNFSVDSMPYDIKIDITDAKQIKIIAECDYTVGMTIALKDMYFLKNDTVPEAVEENTEPVPNVAYCPQDKMPYEYDRADILKNDLSQSFTILGKDYNTGFLIAPDGYIIFENLDGYKTLKFSVAKRDDEERKTKTEFHIFVDGKEVYTNNFSAESKPANIKIDIAGAKQIKITVTCDYIGGLRIAAYDMSFSK